MKKLIPLALILASCAGLKREPSSINYADSIFNPDSSESLTTKNYKFELINLFDLNDKKVTFKTFEISDPNSKKAVASWISDLNGFLTVYSNDISVKISTHEAVVKNRDLKRLQQALNIIAKSDEHQDRVMKKQVELLSAFNQNFKIPEAFNYSSSNIPMEFYDRSKNQISVSNNSFWQSPVLAKKNLIPPELSPEYLSQQICKTESGDNLHSVKLNCSNSHYKITTQNSPKVSAFNSILYRRLGYNSIPIVFVPELQVAYERSALLSLKKLKVNVQINLKDGNVLNFDQLTARLLPYCSSHNESCYSDSALFDSDIENRIEKLTLNEVALQVDNGDHTFGPWTYNELDHPFRTEIKGLLFLGAFCGNTDLRKESNSLVWSGKNFTISHQIQNLSSGLGGARPGAPMNLNAFNWQVLKSKSLRGKTVYIFDGYSPSVNRQAFAELNPEDAKWIVKQIAGLTEDEITEALALSGFSAAELLLAREKLISIQKNLVETLGLEREFGKFSVRKIEKNLSYRLTGQPAKFRITSNRSIIVPESNDELINGTLKKVKAPLFENKRKISNTVDE